jgi:hypothetical protein
MFPWRVVKGVVGFLDTFSKVYGQEPLKRSGPQLPSAEPNLGAIWLHGRMVALNEVRYDSGRGGALVPRSWELVCRNRRGQEYVAARHVASFDVGSDGGVVYSNGFELWRLVDGDWKSIARSNLVEAICAGAP